VPDQGVVGVVDHRLIGLAEQQDAYVEAIALFVEEVGDLCEARTLRLQETNLEVQRDCQVGEAIQRLLRLVRAQLVNEGEAGQSKGEQNNAREGEHELSSESAGEHYEPSVTSL